MGRFEACQNPSPDKGWPSIRIIPDCCMTSTTPPPRQAKPRSLPRAGSYFKAVVVYGFHVLCLIATLTLAVFFIRDGHEKAAVYLGVAIALSAFTGVLSFVIRRGTLCPLCRSTPLLGTSSSLHERARRLWPFTHAVSTILSIAFLQRFRCMHCGTDFDLLKEPRRQKLYRGEQRKHKVRSRRKRRTNPLNRTH